MLTATYTYDAWGNILNETGTVTQPYRFTTRPYNITSGFVDLRARVYVPNVGRFIQRDPLGLISIKIPLLLASGTKFHESFLFVFVEIGCLFLSGIIIGLLRPKRAWLWGIWTMFFFPILAIIEMVADPYSHNIWPIEFVMYGFMTIPSIAGACTGAFIRRKINRRAEM